MSDSTPTKRPLRSAQWFGTADKNGFMYRSWMKKALFALRIDELLSKP